MKFDLIFVTYNSQKWIKRCFNSILSSDYDKKNLNIYIVDNNSEDDTLLEVTSFTEEHLSDFGDINIIKCDTNLGFGNGNNLGFYKGKSEYVFFLNIDTEVHKDTFINIEKEINNSDEIVALWELRQFPYEHPKFYNAITGETTWSSGAAFIVKRDIFEEVGGFDKNIFMYAEDVDLSWRIRAKGYKLRYIPKAVINHYSYENSNEVKPNQYYNSIINNCMLRWRYGSVKQIIGGYFRVFRLMFKEVPSSVSKLKLITKFFKSQVKMLKFSTLRFKRGSGLKSFKSRFVGWDYEIIRHGAFYENKKSNIKPLVSIIVRTCGRPNILREALISIRNQTYENIEVIVIEDGKPISKELIGTEFSDLNIRYHSTGERVGRSKAGNIGMEISKGRYLNFLDDDDIFFSDHVEVLVSNLESSDYKLAYSLAYETPIIVENENPYIYKEMYHNLIYNQPFNKLMLFHHNYIPIQTIMFSREIYEKYGGLDEGMDALEDWDLWVRYALDNDFKYVPKATSIYRVPFDKKASESRQHQLDKALLTVRKKHGTYKCELRPNCLVKDLENLLEAYPFLISNKSFKRIAKFIVSKFNRAKSFQVTHRN